MIKRCFLLCFSVFITVKLVAQVGLLPFAGAQSMSMGEVSTNLTGIHSLFTNQAGLAELNSFAAIVSAERRFDINEIRSVSAGVASNLGSSGTIGISIYSLGIDEYKENKIGVAYAIKLFEKLSIGAQFDWINTRIAEFGSTNSFTAEIGIISKLTNQISIGAHLFSPVRVNVIDNNDIPTNLRLGFEYSPSEIVSFYAEFEKDIDYAEAFKVGVNYEIIDNFHLRSGIKTNPATYSFGLGYFLNNGIGIEGAVSFHEILGLSPGISVVYKRNQQE